MKSERLLQSPQSVFSVNDLAVLWQITERDKLWENIKYYVRTDRLAPLRRGLYARTGDFKPFEAAVRLFPPAYISFTTALAYHGLAFQYSSGIHLMAKDSKQKKLLDGTTFIYHKLKNSALMNHEGLIRENSYWIAGIERSVCDTSYLVPEFIFENIDKIDPKKLILTSRIYDNQKLLERMEKLAIRIKTEAVNNA